MKRRPRQQYRHYMTEGEAAYLACLLRRPASAVRTLGRFRGLLPWYLRDYTVLPTPDEIHRVSRTRHATYHQALGVLLQSARGLACY